MDAARAYVDAVDGEPQGSTPLPLEPALVALFRGEEVGAYEGMGVGGLEAIGLFGSARDVRQRRFPEGRLGRNGSVAAPGGQ